MEFSIIVPVYNVEKYLIECVDSLLSQTFKDFELILVDDGATDNSGAICDEFVKKDARVKVIHKENGGLSDARNKGFSVAQGKYVIFIDSDDYISTNEFLEKIYQKTQKGIDIICYKFKKYFEDTKTFSKCSFEIPEMQNCYDFANNINKLVENDAFYCSVWTKAVKTSILRDNEICFEKGLLGEDQEWYYHVLLKAKSIDGINEDFLIYRQRANSITTSWKMKNLTDCIYVVEKSYKQISESQIDLTLKTALYNSLAKLYCNLLIAYVGFNQKEKKSKYKKLKSMKGLLKYNANPRVKSMNRCFRLVGFNLMMTLLNVIYKIKK